MTSLWLACTSFENRTCVSDGNGILFVFCFNQRKQKTKRYSVQHDLKGNAQPFDKLRMTIKTIENKKVPIARDSFFMYKLE